MPILKIHFEDEQAELLRSLSKEVAFVRSIEEKQATASEIPKLLSGYDWIKKIQQEIGNKHLFKDIPDPSEWQREIRKEWDRDF